jgi:ankyrin repeat protein
MEERPQDAWVPDEVPALGGESPRRDDPLGDNDDGRSSGRRHVDHDRDDDETEVASSDDDEEEQERRRLVVGQFYASLRGQGPVSLSALADLAREYGGDGDILWEGDGSVFKHCFTQLDEHNFLTFLCELVSERSSLDQLLRLVRAYGGGGALLWADEAEFLFRCVHVLSTGMLCDLFRLLVAEYPNLLSDTHDDQELMGGTLLHNAASIGAPTEVVRFLVDSDRAALPAREPFMGLLPIHCALMRWKLPQVLLLLEADPATAQIKDDDGHLPLHVACQGALDCPLARQIIKTLIEHTPTLEASTDHQGMTPITLALESASRLGQVDPEVIDLLHRMIDRGCASSLPGDPWGTALHAACYHLPDPGLLLSLIGAYRAALETSDHHGRLPLHVACCTSTGRCSEAIALLIEASPAALEARDNSGRTPIMIALAMDAAPLPPRLLHEMVRRSPQSVRGILLGAQYDGAPPVESTALEAVCKRTPSAEYLVLAVMKAWPPALCFSLTGDLNRLGLPQDVAAEVIGGARIMFLALVEVLLHDTTRGTIREGHGAAESTRGVVSEATRGRVLRAIGQFVNVRMLLKDCSFAVVQEILKKVHGDDFWALRSDVLNDHDVRQTLVAQESLLEMVTGVYCMNKAGRLGPEGSTAPDSAAFSARQHVQVLESAKDNPSCLFLHVRGCPALFAQAREGEGIDGLGGDDGAGSGATAFLSTIARAGRDQG